MESANKHAQSGGWDKLFKTTHSLASGMRYVHLETIHGSNEREACSGDNSITTDKIFHSMP